MVARVMISGTWRPMAEVLAILNHPGHSSQKSHGRKGDGSTGGGVRDALGGHGSAEEVSRAAAAEAKRITGRDIEFALEGDPQLAAEHAEGVLQGLERFPDAPLKRVDMIDLPDQQYGQCSDMSGEGWGAERISFSRSASTDPEGYRQRLAELGQEGRMGRQTVAADPRGVALHEFGHSVANGNGANIGAGTRAKKFRTDAGATRTDPDAARAAGRVAQGKEISRYSLQNDHELAAEAFADVMLNGDSASGLSKDIFAHIEASESR